MKILCIGDIVGKPGRNAIRECLQKIRKEHFLDFVIANGENIAGGSGITPRLAEQLFSSGCDVVTSGDHIWDQKETENYLDEQTNILRPANFPEETPGESSVIVSLPSGVQVAVVNILGRVFMKYHVECPFRAIEKILEEIKKQTNIIIVDFHAEATSEKVAFGHFVNGKVSAVFGTHTHIQTADERVLSEGTAYITDVGMTGPHDSVIGQNKEGIIKRFITSLPVRFHVASGDVKINGVIFDIDEKTGLARGVERFSMDVAPSEIFS